METMRFTDITPTIRGIQRSRIHPELEREVAYKRGTAHRLMLPLRGQCLFHIGGDTLRCTPGCVLYSIPNTPYTTSFQGDIVEVLNIHFDFDRRRLTIPTGPLIAYDDDPDIPDMAQPMRFSDTDVFDRSFVLGSLPDAADIAHRILEEEHARLLGYRLRQQAILTEMLVYLWRQRTYGGTETRDHTTESVLSYIREHCAERLDRHTLARNLHYHPDSLNRMVLAATGMTLHRYILDARIHRAEGMLAESDVSVTEIAHALSFYDGSHFAQVFRDMRGCTPHEYRRAIRE